MLSRFNFRRRLGRLVDSPRVLLRPVGRRLGRRLASLRAFPESVRARWALESIDRRGRRRERRARVEVWWWSLRARLTGSRHAVARPRGRARWMALLSGVGLVVSLTFGVSRLDFAPRAEATRIEVGHLPTLPLVPRQYAGVALADHLESDGLAPEHRDEFLESPVLRDPDFARSVHAWIRYWTGPAATWFPGFLDRMAWMGAAVDSAIAAEGLPRSLRYLPLIESGYDPSVTSRASAVGLWQFMPVTARGLGLEISPLVDERRHPDKSTMAAVTYLSQLRREFGSWHLALAAYNSGPTRVRTILRRHAPDEAPTDSLFWALRDHFPAETREFVPKLYGAMWVASRPDGYGFEASTVAPRRFDLVRVSSQTTLDVVGLAAGVPHAEIVRLNPEYLRGMTPPDRRVTVRIPEGRARTFNRIYPRIRPQDRVNFVDHVVRSGETLSLIAARYGVEVEEMEAVNPAVEARTLGVGVRLVVPVARAAEGTGTMDQTEGE